MPKRVTLYQKPDCRTCRRTRHWFEGREDVDVLERDILLTPPSFQFLDTHVPRQEPELRRFLNHRSGIYRRYGLARRLPEREALVELMAREPDLIRRPLVVRGRRAVFGHDEEAFADLIG